MNHIFPSEFILKSGCENTPSTQKICFKPVSSNLSLKSSDHCVWAQVLGTSCSLTSRLRNTSSSPDACVIRLLSTQRICKNDLQNISVHRSEVADVKWMDEWINNMPIEMH